VALLLGGAPAVLPRPVHRVQGPGHHRAGAAGSPARQGAGGAALERRARGGGGLTGLVVCIIRRAVAVRRTPTDATAMRGEHPFVGGAGRAGGFKHADLGTLGSLGSRSRVLAKGENKAQQQEGRSRQAGRPAGPLAIE